MELVKALKLLRGKRGARLNFWYCAGDSDGNPLLMMSKKKISSQERQSAIKTAKKKQFTRGTLVWGADDVLEVAPHGGVPATFDKSLKKIVKKHVTPPKAIKVLDTVLDPPESDELEHQELGEHYAGEEKSFGWRVDTLPDDRLQAFVDSFKGKKPEAFVAILGLKNVDELDAALAGKSADELREILRKYDGYVTRYHDEAQKEESRARIGADGLLRDAAGEVIGDGRKERKGYVMDPETGQVHTFTGGTEKTPDGARVTHHSSPLAGGDVAGAGHLTVEEGRVRKIDDMSGHYRPDAQKTLQVLRRLEKLGAKLVDDRLVDQHGYELGEEDSKEYRVLEEYEKTRKLLLGQLLAAWKEDVARAKEQSRPAPDRPELPQYDPAMEELRRKFSERGAGPANKSTKVQLVGKKGLSEQEFEQVKGDLGAINALLEKKTGREKLLKDADKPLLQNRTALNIRIGERLSVKLSKEQFEQTGGNEDQIRAKGGLNAQIKKDLRTRREALDAQAKQERKDVIKKRLEARIKEVGGRNATEALAKLLGEEVDALGELGQKEVIQALLDPRVLERVRPRVDREVRVLGAIRRQGGRNRDDLRKAVGNLVERDEDSLSEADETYMVELLLGEISEARFLNSL